MKKASSSQLGEIFQLSTRQLMSDFPFHDFLKFSFLNFISECVGDAFDQDLEFIDR